MRQKEHVGQEQRQYIRLDSVFPVQFRLISKDGTHIMSEWYQGFTSDVSKGGIGLTVNNLNPEFAKLLKEQNAKLYLNIEIPLAKHPVSAQAQVTWTKDFPDFPHRYFFGLKYEQIETAHNSRIMHYARAKQIFAPGALIILVILGLGFLGNSIINAQLLKGNKILVEQLLRIVQDSSVAKQKIRQISKEKEGLELNLDALQLRIKAAEEQKLASQGLVQQEAAESAQKIAQLNALIAQLNREKQEMQEGLISIQRRESVVTGELLRLDQKKATLARENFDKMYQWVKIHQDPRTGLVMSFEGDTSVADWAFTYDQSLAAQAYTYFSDFERARKIFDFYSKKAKKQNWMFLNAYYVNDGNVAEYVAHSGPNIWLGIAILHYSRKANDTRYLPLAEKIADGIISMQNEDKDGGIRGGLNMPWYSTEHNLDAYAFFSMLFKITAQPRYEEAAQKTLAWLVKNTYGRPELPIKRGKGDATIATDTYAWSIAALGPQKLESLQMQPDRIIEFAEKNCAVEVSFQRPDGRTVTLKGFDFAPQKHVARAGIISSEWTAQMVIAFKAMSEYYYKKGMPAKGRSFALKADEYLLDLSNMIISSPSPSGQGESCLVYATQEFADTGHGWFTPKGKSTGSLASTIYGIFAYYYNNPLELKD